MFFFFGNASVSADRVELLIHVSRAFALLLLLPACPPTAARSDTDLLLAVQVFAPLAAWPAGRAMQLQGSGRWPQWLRRAGKRNEGASLQGKAMPAAQCTATNEKGAEAPMVESVAPPGVRGQKSMPEWMKRTNSGSISMRPTRRSISALMFLLRTIASISSQAPTP